MTNKIAKRFSVVASKAVRNALKSYSDAESDDLGSFCQQRLVEYSQGVGWDGMLSVEDDEALVMRALQCDIKDYMRDNQQPSTSSLEVIEESGLEAQLGLVIEAPELVEVEDVLAQAEQDARTDAIEQDYPLLTMHHVRGMSEREMVAELGKPKTTVHRWIMQQEREFSLNGIEPEETPEVIDASTAVFRELRGYLRSNGIAVTGDESLEELREAAQHVYALGGIVPRSSRIPKTTAQCHKPAEVVTHCPTINGLGPCRKCAGSDHGAKLTGISISDVMSAGEYLKGWHRAAYFDPDTDEVLLPASFRPEYEYGNGGVAAEVHEVEHRPYTEPVNRCADDLSEQIERDGLDAVLDELRREYPDALLRRRRRHLRGGLQRWLAGLLRRAGRHG